MGLRKTIQTISVIAYLIENKGVMGPHLIVAPKTVLPNWMSFSLLCALSKPFIKAILFYLLPILNFVSSPSLQYMCCAIRRPFGRDKGDDERVIRRGEVSSSNHSL